ncbi:hypothetical protein [Chitinilyticum litopenaei]|uniref:hypothetical protein n=1 Tax=Chitinilyticum litopenaei TaxID=1121276 RepID=UPI0004235999|nr:hypothetical protein [Chitinilyticum litopenaei]
MKRLLLLLGLCCCAQLGAAGPQWGRLFLTPAERLHSAPATEAAGAAGVTASGVAAAPRRFDGMLQRSQGRPLYWVDGQPQRQPPPARVRPGEIWGEAASGAAAFPRIRLGQP